MALGSTQPQTEMSTRNLAGGKGRPADILTAICEPIVQTVWEPGFDLRSDCVGSVDKMVLGAGFLPSTSISPASSHCIECFAVTYHPGLVQ
jgi:hypothetical protein